MSKAQKGLGRGLSALIGASDAMNHDSEQHELHQGEEALAVGVLRMLPRSALQAGQYQPRSQMDETALAELAHSIETQGVMQPIIVRPIAEGRYEIIAGERRYRAAGLAGLDEVPVLIKQVGDQEALSLALIENIQREDLNPLEEAQGLQRLIQEFHFTHDTCAQAIGRSRSAVSNLLRLLHLAAPVQTMLLAGDIEMGHARSLLSLSAAEQVMLATEIANRRLSVRDAEKRVQQMHQAQSQNEGATKATRPISGDLAALQTRLSDALGAAVTIKVGARNQGKLVVNFASLDVLDGIIAKITPQEI